MKYAELRQINVSPHIEKKNGLAYLSWTWAVDQLLQLDNNAAWEYGEPKWFGQTLMVFCSVKAFGKIRTAQLPVMDYYNRAIANPDAFAVNTAMQRCLAKAISLHGIGLYIYAGEDVPRETVKTTEAEVKAKNQERAIKAKETARTTKPVSPPQIKITPTAGAMDPFTQDEQDLLNIIAEKITHLTENQELKEATDILESLTNEEKLAVWSLLESKTRTKAKAFLKNKGDT